MRHQLAGHRHLLIVEDEKALREALAERLAEIGFSVAEAPSGETAVEKLADFAFDVVVTDLRLPGIDGLKVLEAALRLYPDIIVIVVTGYGTVKDAVDAIKRGAADFVTKPFQFDELRHVIESAFEQRRLRSENAYLKAQLEKRYRFDEIIGHSRPMRDLFQLLETVAATSSTILITGETGTGKELVARAIHHNGPRKAHRFVALNCGAIPETLLEAELFGHVRGAFTGAVQARAGRLEQANRGTLFLDEVGNMSPSLQMKLLRVLQEKEFERLGESTPMRVDVRVIAATNSDLRKMVRDGAFRDDLFYRLNVIPLTLPPLRERKEDIPHLIRHFLDQFCASMAQPPKTVSQEAMRRLMGYAWPGNVRQLENVVERAVALSLNRTEIEVSDLPDELRGETDLAAGRDLAIPDDGVDLAAVVSSVERELILRSLEKAQGNRRQAAKLLKLKRTTLIEKLKRMGDLSKR